MIHSSLLPKSDWARFDALEFTGWDRVRWTRERGDENKKLVLPFLIAARLVQSASQALRDESLREFDPIVKENSCHVRAGLLLLLFRDEATRRRLEELSASAARVEATIRSFMKNPKQFLKEDGASMRAQDVSLELPDDPVSEQVKLLVLMHFLTVGKEFSMSESGKEVCKIMPFRMSRALRLPKSTEPLLQRMVPAAQSHLSRLTVRLLQREARRLFGDAEALPCRMLAERKIVDIGELTGHKEGLMSSCAPFNFDVVLEGLLQSRTLVLVKERSGGTERQFFRGLDPIAEEEVIPGEPLFVIEGFLPGGRAGLLEQIARVGGLREAILINVTHLPLFGVEGRDDRVEDEEAEAVIAGRRLRAKELGCQLQLSPGRGRSFFTIAHTFAAKQSEIE